MVAAEEPAIGPNWRCYLLGSWRHYTGSSSPRLHLRNIPRVLNDRVEHAAKAVAAADAIVVTAGAGMGVDSGLPDFRGREGFWRAYPVFARLGLTFEQVANPAWFVRDPELAWGFYRHRLNLYRDTVPHSGFATLLHWIQSKPAGGFVITSNVDCHGSLQNQPVRVESKPAT